MDTLPHPKSISAPPEQLDLGNFLNAAANAGANARDFSELLNLLGKQLVEHANCIAVFWVDLLNTEAPQLKLAATSLESCPDSIYQWACTTAAQALTQGRAITEEPAANPLSSQPFSMVALPIQTDANQVLAALFIGDNAKRNFPFMQLAADRIVQWDANESLKLERQTSVDIAALQEISLAVADSTSTQQGCRKLANHLKDHLREMTAQTELTIFIGKNTLDKFPTLVGVSDSDSLPDNPQLIEAVESAMAECISRNAETCWPPEGENFSLLCHKRLANLANDHSICSYQLPDSTGGPQAVLTVNQTDR